MRSQALPPLLLLAAAACGMEPTATTRAAASVGARPVVCAEGACLETSQPGVCQFVADHYPALAPGTYLEVLATELPVGASTASDGMDTFTTVLADGGAAFDWSATTGVDFVVASGAAGAFAYFYPGEAASDALLHAILGEPIFSVAFCYDADATAPPAPLMVEKTAFATPKRTWQWTIAKTSPVSALTLAAGEARDVAYAVRVEAAPVDADWLVTGAIVIHNPSAVAAVGVEIADTFAGIPVTPDCGPGFEGTIPAGATVTCSYAVLPGATIEAVNVVTVTTAGGPAGATASVPVVVRAPASVVDACVTVTDDPAGALGTACADAGPATFSYVLPVGPYASCDDSAEGTSFVNTARFTAPSGATGSATWSVLVSVTCASPGCTLTQGYWKTHGVHGPAPFDDAWLLAGPASDDTLFAASGLSFHDVLTTAPRGNAWFILAHQYVAASMNVLAGADPAAVAAELAWARAFFAVHTPDHRYRPPVAQVMIATAGALDRYNNGLTGPGHCE